MVSNVLRNDSAATDGLCVEFGGWRAWMRADCMEARRSLANDYARYRIEDAPDIRSGVTVVTLAAPFPRIQITADAVPCEIATMFTGPEWKRFARLPHPSRNVFADSLLGPEAAVEIDGENLIVLQPARWPLYAYLAAQALMLRQQPLLGLHAAVSAVDDTAVVLVGPSGSGKSTLSLALHQHGADYFGDDWVYFSLPDFDLHVGHQDLCMRPGGIDAIQLNVSDQDWREIKPNDRKCIMPLPESRRPCPRNRALLIFMSGFAPEARLAPVGGGEAVRRLLRSISCGDPSPGARIEAAAGLVERYPCTALSVGRPEETARLVAEYARCNR